MMRFEFKRYGYKWYPKTWKGKLVVLFIGLLLLVVFGWWLPTTSAAYQAFRTEIIGRPFENLDSVSQVSLIPVSAKFHFGSQRDEAEFSVWLSGKNASRLVRVHMTQTPYVKWKVSEMTSW